MWIRRLAVSHWRGLDFELNGLAPGMNLIFGPNESGKSRLVEALRFALFESSSGRSAHKKALTTWGVAPHKPRVTVEFDLAGMRWTLTKEFLGTGHNTALRSDIETLEGAEAEMRLAELMGVGPGGRAELKIEDRGIWSLLWVDQGASREAPVHNESSQTQIHDRLTREIGEVAAGELGQQILRRAEELRNRFYTSSRDAEKSILGEPRENVANLRRRLDEATARRDAVADDADELDRGRAAERDLVGRVAQVDQRLGDLRGQHEQAVDLGRRLELYDEQVRTCESQRERCLQALQAVETLTSQIDSLSTQAREAASVQAAAEATRQASQRLYDEASRAAAAADQRCAGQENQVLELRRRRDLAAIQEQTGQLRTRLDGAAEVSERIAGIQQELARLPPVTGQDVERLRNAREARDAARARLEGASASVELEAHRDLRISGETLGKGDTRRVLVEDEQHLEVEGVMSITVRPGGGELPRLRDAVNDAERTLAQLLGALSFEDLADAVRVADQRRDREGELERCRVELRRQLPEGREAVESQVRELEGRLAKQSRGSDLLIANAGDSRFGSWTGSHRSHEIEQAEAQLRALASQREALRAKRDVALENLTAARETVATTKADLESRRRQLDEAHARREALPDPAGLQAELAEVEKTWRQRLAARDEMEERFDALGGEDLEVDLEQATRASEQLTAELEQIRLSSVRLQARLESAGDDGRHERVQELAAELVRAEAELAGIERQAAAARRLHEVLTAEYDSARERLTQPVVSRIRPYLQSLFPDAEVWLDDDLNLLGLRSRQTDQQFEALSGGAREQLSLLVRIGLAEVIGADEPWPLVLDDVLVNTDAERIRQVQRLLYQASRRMQILLFTCHGPLFDTLGPDVRIELPRPRTGRGAADGVVDLDQTQSGAL